MLATQYGNHIADFSSSGPKRVGVPPLGGQ